uniref:Uncharacterized protein n=1 Tax=Arundo donax TaxID=35708 RepID=A0A0A9HRK8_ARUDO
MEESCSSSGRQEDAAPPWAPGEATAFRRFASAAASGRSLEASPSAAGNGVAARVSSLHGVRRKSVRLGLLPLVLLLPNHQIPGNCKEVACYCS